MNITKFLFPHTFSTNNTLTFSLRNAVVCVAVVDGLTTENLTAFVENRTHEFFELTQAIRHDAWVTVKHLSVSYEDLWIRLCYGHELRETQFRRDFSESDVVLVAVIDVGSRCDASVIATSLDGAARSSSVMRSSTSLVNSMLKRHSGRSLKLSRAEVVLGIDLLPETASILQKKAYLSSSNTLEDILGCGSDTTNATETKETMHTVRVTQVELDRFLRAQQQQQLLNEEAERREQEAFNQQQSMQHAQPPPVHYHQPAPQQQQSRGPTPEPVASWQAPYEEHTSNILTPSATAVPLHQPPQAAHIQTPQPTSDVYSYRNVAPQNSHHHQHPSHQTAHQPGERHYITRGTLNHHRQQPPRQDPNDVDLYGDRSNVSFSARSAARQHESSIGYYGRTGFETSYHEPPVSAQIRAGRVGVHSPYRHRRY